MATLVSHAPITLPTATDVTTDVLVDAVPVAAATEPESAESVEVSEPEPTMSENTYVYKVQMNCGGCSGAIERALGKAQNNGAGISSYTVSLENQTVEVKGGIAQADLTATIAKTGKKILEEPIAAA
ncbi:hypothetical protein M0805_001778 [Coniferiporia weirii]|nr:hypothetical protein M0805_001778 [Coniferiporia weirii]